MSTRLPLPADDALDDATRARLAQRPPIDLYRMVAHAPGLLAPFMALGAANFHATQLPPSLREALILRVAMHHRSAYQIHHRRMAREAGLSDATIDALLSGAAAGTPWDASIGDAVALADALCTSATVGPALLRRMVQAHGHRGYAEMSLVVGFYRMVATFIDATGLRPETQDVVGSWRGPGAR